MSPVIVKTTSLVFDKSRTDRQAGSPVGLSVCLLVPPRAVVPQSSSADRPTGVKRSLCDDERAQTIDH